jgi:ABC-2 type transport system permease protein
VNPRRISALMIRIIRQFRRDPRTLGLLFVVPVVILSLLGYIYRGSEDVVILGINAEVDTPTLETAMELVRQDERVELRFVARDYNAAIENGDVEGVLELPAQGVTHAAAEQVTLYLEGSDPVRAQRLVDASRQILPALTVLELADFEGELIEPDLAFQHGGPEFDQLDFLAPVFIGFFAFFFVFLLTSVSFLRERMQGSIERLMVSPISRPEIVTGYMLGFSLFAAIQSALIIAFSIWVLEIHQVGNVGLVFLVTLVLTLGAVNLGIFLSTFAKTELQVVQFIPVVIVPQGMLSGMIWPVDSLPAPLWVLSQVLPLTWANEAMRSIMIRGASIESILPELGLLAGFAGLMVLLGSLTLRRDVV